MGEVVLSSEDLEMKGDSEVEKQKRITEKTTTMKDGCGSSGAITSFEKFLPRMMMRVLLVEADDSTRQIIAALLRKCSYRGIVFFLLQVLVLLSFFSLLG